MRRRCRKSSAFIAAALVAQRLVTVSAVSGAQARVPDAATVASLHELIQTGRTEEAQEQLKRFDSTAPHT